jgi:hypothetical protein
MADDWRVTATLRDAGQAQRAIQSLRDRKLQDDVRRRLGRLVAVSADKSHMFLYAASGDAAREAEKVVREVFAEQQLPADLTVDRWDALKQKWVDPGSPVPGTAEVRRAEHQRVMDEETRQSLAHRQPGWEVQVNMPSHREAIALAERLSAEGHPLIRRWKYLILGANNEDDARELAQAIERQAPPAASVRVKQALFDHYGPAQVAQVFPQF